MSAVIDIATLAANEVNEDRAGAAGAFAWVIDGATDVIETPLTKAATDASWIAETLDSLLRQLTDTPPPDLADLPAILTGALQSEFRRAAKRQPIGRHEHPSAAGLIVRTNGAHLDYVAVGDCSLLVTTSAGVLRIGVNEKDAGDLWVADALRTFRARHPEAALDAAHAHLWPKLGAARWAMNQSDGYGVFSLTPNSVELHQTWHSTSHARRSRATRVGWIDAARRRFSSLHSRGAVGRGGNRGLASLAQEVRALEEADRDCLQFPRAKRCDDATGVLLSFSTS